MTTNTHSITFDFFILHIFQHLGLPFMCIIEGDCIEQFDLKMYYYCCWCCCCLSVRRHAWNFFEFTPNSIQLMKKIPFRLLIVNRQEWILNHLLTAVNNTQFDVIVYIYQLRALIRTAPKSKHLLYDKHVCECEMIGKNHHDFNCTHWFKHHFKSVFNTLCVVRI